VCDLGRIAEESDSVDEANMHDRVLEDTREFDDPDSSLKEMQRLLEEGQGMTIDEMTSALDGGVTAYRSHLCATASTKTTVHVL
jgi:ubiquinone/menaquinone biosynthesis C-methylase UbiE